MPVLLQNTPCSGAGDFNDYCCGGSEQGGLRHTYFVDKEYDRITLQPAIAAALLLGTEALQDAAIIAAFDAARANGKAFKISDVKGTFESTNETSEGFGDNELEVLGAMATTTFDSRKVRNNMPNLGKLNGLTNFVQYYTTENILWYTAQPVTIETMFKGGTTKEKVLQNFKTTWRIPRDSNGEFVYPDHYRKPEGLFACSDQPDILFLNTSPAPSIVYFNFGILFDTPCAGGGSINLNQVVGSIDGLITGSFQSFTMPIPANNIANIIFAILQTAAITPGQLLTFTFQLSGCNVVPAQYVAIQVQM